jgi:hypothetical protein
MQAKGADIDIVTGRPVELKRKADEAIREKIEQDGLKRQAELAGLVQSDAGQLLVKLIGERLDARIEQLVSSDPEATAYVNVLKEMGNKDRIGREAMKRIVAARLGQAL